jgi:hypothetical protein
MIDLATIGAALTAAGAATGVINGALDAADRITKRGAEDPEVQKELLAIYRALVTATRDIATTEARLMDLRAQLEKLDRFEEEARRFGLMKTEDGAVVWGLQESRDGEPMQYLCTNCYEDRIISRLQPANFAKYGCPRCKVLFPIKTPKATAPRTFRDFGEGMA